MKQITVVFRVVLLIAVSASFAACSGGAFNDPGHGGGGGSGGRSSKPSHLSSDASYEQAASKLEEIISYCNKHSGNETIKSQAEMVKSDANYYQSTWSYAKQGHITGINSLIDGLK